jgi:REase associating with pPIWI_RE
MGSLSEEANDYLAEVLFAKDESWQYAGTIVKQLAIDNQKFTRILDKLRDAYNEGNSEKAQQEYLVFRPFLVKHQYATGRGIRKAFQRTRYISPEDVGELYEDCESDRDYWYCDRCGILTETSRRLKGLKPRLCGNHHQNLSYVRRIKEEVGLRRIKDGIHQRVCFPGIPELNLYDALEELKAEHPDYLQEVYLYPGADRYDIQLHFSDDTVWVIDFKDVRDPYKLAKTLKGLYGEGSLRYNESFYVISDRCIANYSDYTNIAKEEAKKLPKQQGKRIKLRR